MMKRQRLLALLLAAAMMITTLSGCAGTDEPAEEPTGTSTDELSASPNKSHDADDGTTDSNGEEEAAASVMPVNSSAALAAGLSPDDVVLYAEGGIEVTWRELAYWIYTSYSYFVYSYGDITDWDEALYQEETGEVDSDGNAIMRDVTVESYLMWDATEMARLYAGVELFAEENEIGLTEQNETEMAEARASDIESYGSEEAYLEAIADGGMDEAFLYKLNKISCLYNNTFAKLYGSTGGELPDEEVVYYAELYGYMRAKHVLLSFDETTTDEDKQAMRDTLDGLLDNLEAADDKEALFDHYVAEYGQDPGMESFPDGYTFASGEMVSAFENATYSLRNYGISGIIETDYGYHIIMRLPLGAEHLTTSGVALADGLRYDAAAYYFDQVIQNYVSGVDLTETDKYGLIGVSAVLSEL